MFSDNLERIVNGVTANYEADEIFFTKPDCRFPSRSAVIDIIRDLRRLCFPGYFGPEQLTGATSPDYFVGDTLIRIEAALRTQLMLAYGYTNRGTMDHAQLKATVDEVLTRFFDEVPHVQRVLLTDVQAAFDGDPAAGSKEEIIFSYPGMYAIFVYRFAHVLYDLKVPLIPRIMSEYAHGGTGIDINPGATIGEYFFIDHGTGVVVGETCHIGSHVKLYQGVTLGALSTRGGQALKNVQRHPTIQDNVTVYSNASVLGGETVVGEGSIIAGGAFVTESVPPHSRVSMKGLEVHVRTPQVNPTDWEV